VFEGEVSLECNGRFASVRGARIALGSADALGYGLSVRADGKRYRMNQRTEDTFDGANDQAELQPQAGG
jgi:NADH dehydrogenase [ubiquinone] 1 alpha subcomplex assembly factor 1